MSRCSPPIAATITITLTQLPNEVQIHILSFLRSFDIGPVQQTCRFYNNPDRIHEVVTLLVHHVYGTEFTDGIIIDLATTTNCNNNNNNNNNKNNNNNGNDNGNHDTAIHDKKSGKNHNHNHNHNKKNDRKHHNKSTTTTTSKNDNKKAPPHVTSTASDDNVPFRYTLGHLRSIELTVVARVLSLPEPKTGYFVSKSWIKKTLLWLEKVNEQPMHYVDNAAGAATSTASSLSSPKKKLTKKQQRQRNRRLSDVSAPWPNVNSDILCEHQNLQRSGAKVARSHRKLMDKKSWKILRKLYPDSTQLESVTGECLQCLMETETARKDDQDRLEQQKLQRKQPLSNPHVRRFYTRTRGVPYHCLVENNDSGDDDNNGKDDDDGQSIKKKDADDDDDDDDGGGGKMCVNGGRTQRGSSSSSNECCPLTSGTYVILPRSWCHQWRRYIKTGEGSMPLPPESSALLCDAHKMAVLPPHLEAFLNGDTPQLFASVKQDVPSSYSPVLASVAAASVAVPRSPVGVQPILDIETINALVAAGISRTEAATQRMAMLQIEEDQQQQRQRQRRFEQRFEQPQRVIVNPESSSSSCCNNELLDRENHVVTELVTHEEWLALQETGCWLKQQVSTSNLYSMCVTVDKDGSFAFSTLPCRECDPTGLRFSTTCASMKNMFRSKRWEPKNVEQKRIPPNLEYY